MKKILKVAAVIAVGVFLSGEVLALEPVNAGFGKIKLDGLLQGRYTRDFETEAIDQFKIRRTELKFSGEIAEGMNWTVMLDPARAIGGGEGADTTSDDSANKQKKRILQDLKLECIHLPMTKITLGQFKIPFSMEGLTSSSKLATIERAMLNSKGKLGDKRDIGLQATAGIDMAKLTLGIFNGEGQNTSDVNEHKDFAARLSIDPMKGLHFGFAHYNGKKGEGRTETANNGIELSFEHDMFFLGSELGFGKSGNTKSRGWYVVAGFNVIPEKLQVVVKGDSWDPNTDVNEDRTEEVTLGINHFMLKHRAKFQLNYTFKVEEDANTKWDDTLVAQLQYSF